MRIGSEVFAMTFKKLRVIFMMIVLSLFLISCDYIITLRPNTTVSTMMSTLPVPINGTITFDNTDYDDFQSYQSPTYDLTDIEAYNDVLLDTQEHIRRANIDINANLYEDRKPFPWSEDTVRFDVGTSSGSGFVFLEDESYYYAITNYHVVDPGEYAVDYEVKAYGDDEFTTATLLAVDESLDLAVLRFLKIGRESVELLDIFERLYYRFTPGELVLAVGNPYDLQNNVTFGEFRSMESIDNVSFDVIYHSAAINEGSSGGALVDVDGYLIGVNTWGLDSVDVNAFAIPNYIVYMFLINNGILE